MTRETRQAVLRRLIDGLDIETLSSAEIITACVKAVPDATGPEIVSAMCEVNDAQTIRRGAVRAVLRMEAGVLSALHGERQHRSGGPHAQT